MPSGFTLLGATIEVFAVSAQVSITSPSLNFYIVNVQGLAQFQLTDGGAIDTPSINSIAYADGGAIEGISFTT